MRHRSPPGWRRIALRAWSARWVIVSLALLAVLTALIGLAFAGSSVRIADGVQIAGVDVGGLTKNEARTLLERRSEEVARVPVVFTAGGKEYPIKATTLGVEADWTTAIESAAREGEGFGPVRGFKRLQTRFFGIRDRAAGAGLRGGARVQARGPRTRDRPAPCRGEARSARPRRRGRPRPVRSAARPRRGRGASRPCPRGGSTAGRPVALPVLLDPVEVTAADLAPAAAQARIALSAPVRLEYEGTRWKLPRWRIAELLSLPVDGATRRSRSPAPVRRPGSRSCATRSSGLPSTRHSRSSRVASTSSRTRTD